MKPDAFLIAIAAAVALAFAAPSLGAGDGPLAMGAVTDAGIALVFLLHGAAIAPAAMRAAVGHWRLHLLVQSSTWVLFPLLGLAVWHGGAGWLSPEARLGYFFLCAVSSTISSSVAMTAMARGNVPGAVFDATLSSLIGMIATPLLIALVADTAGGGAPVWSQVGAILGKLLLPFALGQALRPWLSRWLDRHKALVGRADRVVIVLIVWTAFSDSVAAGLWTRDHAASLIPLALLSAATLALVLILTRAAARAFGFAVEDEIAAVFCGSKKSLANGAPIAKVLFAGSPSLGLILVPLLLYHQLQLIVCTVMARRYAARERFDRPDVGVS